MDRETSSRSERRTVLIAKELSRYNIDIAALSETRLADEGYVAEPKGGYTFFWKGKDQDEERIHGIGLAIRSVVKLYISPTHRKKSKSVRPSYNIDKLKHPFHRDYVVSSLDNKLTSHGPLTGSPTQQWDQFSTMGCVLAPVLFNLFFTCVLSHAVRDIEDGVYIRYRMDGSPFDLRRLSAKTKTIEKLILEALFADDYALMAHTESTLQLIVNNHLRVHPYT
ncbi:hypothetical protein ACOMHN_029395 [Nucella lapillus]